MLVSSAQAPNRAPIRSLLAGFCVSVASTALAMEPTQPMPNLEPVSGPQVKPAFSSKFGATPDVAALQYYALRGEQGRVNAELRRLSLLYPEWRQPENIFNTEDPKEKQLWELFSKGTAEDVDSELERLQAEDPSFRPSDELLTMLGERKQRAKIADSWKQQQWQTVVDLANENTNLLLGRDVELIWMLGEAYVHLNRPSDALDAFHAAYEESSTEKERQVSLQKAASMISVKAAMTIRSPSDTSKPLDAQARAEELAIVRGYLGRAANVGERTPTVLKNALEKFEAETAAEKNLSDSLLLGWGYFGQRQWDKAESWFRKALALAESSKAAEGTILSLINQKKMDDARQLSSQWRDGSAELAELYLQAHADLLRSKEPESLTGEFLNDFSQVTLAQNSGEGAEALGWLAFRIKQYQTARAWFDQAINWELTETAALGATLSARSLKDQALFDELHGRYAQKFARVAELKFKEPVDLTTVGSVQRVSRSKAQAGSLRKRISAAHDANNPAKCLQLTRKLRQYGPLRAEDHQMKGWCLLDLKRPSEASRAFSASLKLKGKGRQAAAYGKTLSVLRMGLTNEALDIANTYALTSSQRKTVNIEILTQRARSAFSNRDYGAALIALDRRQAQTVEGRDLNLMRAWSLFHLGHAQSAKALFQTLDHQLSTRETRRGLRSAHLATDPIQNNLNRQ